MVAKPKKRATYQDVLDAPEHMVAEILDGELFLTSGSRRKHLENASSLGAFLKSAFDFGIGGPGGWRVLKKPELHHDLDIVVPDIAGWRDGRLVDAPDEDEPYITVVPDWLCEVQSPGTARIDRMKKMPIYAREGVRHVWLADPRERAIDVYRLNGRGGFTFVGTVGGDEPIRAEPFDDVEIAPTFVWGRPAAPGSAKTVAKKKRASTKKPSARTSRRR
ncbi:MAG: Uma2 family endonuclease [Labilithrix sp.]|nr:Uma2 family endonuclease [Labilithrix sp.]MCW5810913.1 Uma2 family endonuclease [Labilithrix sp.]